MKKMMVAAFAVAFAAVAQAASVNWCSGTMEILPSCTGDGDYSINECVMAYVWEFSTQQYTSADQVWSAVQDGTLSLADAYTEQADFLFGEANVAGGSEWTEGDTVYAAVLYLHSDTQDFDAADYYMANIASATAADSGADVFDLGTSAGGATAWASTAAIPEPTSGLLLLIGMAGLALRRRRA